MEGCRVEEDLAVWSVIEEKRSSRLMALGLVLDSKGEPGEMAMRGRLAPFSSQGEAGKTKL